MCISVLWQEHASAETPETAQYDPVASPGACVVYGNARFTVLTPRLIRMEWSADARFEDRATLGIVNRKLEVPEFDVRKSAGSVTVQTEYLTLKYRGNGKFSGDNLSITFRTGRDGKEKVKWYPGADASGNLLGTARTLDRCDGETVIDPYDPGIISKDGWAVIDESGRHVFVPVDSDWKNWVESRDSTDRQDLYFFGYGHDYKAAISDFTQGRPRGLHENIRKDTSPSEIHIRLLVVPLLAILGFRAHRPGQALQGLQHPYRCHDHRHGLA